MSGGCIRWYARLVYYGIVLHEIYLFKALAIDRTTKRFHADTPLEVDSELALSVTPCSSATRYRSPGSIHVYVIEALGAESPLKLSMEGRLLI